jgi:hypothetical protein
MMFTAAINIDHQKLLDTRLLLTRELGHECGQELAALPGLCARRRAILATHLSPEDLRALLAISSVLHTLEKVNDELAESMRSYVHYELTQVVDRLDSLEYIHPQRAQKALETTRDLPHLVLLSHNLRGLQRESGLLDRAELALYRHALRRRSGSHLLRHLRQLTRDLKQGRAERIELRCQELEAALCDEGIGENQRDAIAATKALRSLAPTPAPWLRRLLVDLLQNQPVPLTAVHDATLRRLRREQSAIAELVHLSVDR